MRGILSRRLLGDLRHRPWPDYADAEWRRHFPPMCYRCLRRMIAGAMYDSMATTWDGADVRAKLVRWAYDEADEYLGCLFGET